jgi:hypothetical protein
MLGAEPCFLAESLQGRIDGAEAGILGNTFDRLALGYVRDFLVTWAIPNYVFNVADLLVVIGCASLFITRYLSARISHPKLGFPAMAATC